MSSSATTSTTSGNVTQYGFFFDQSRCYNCHTCVIACRQWNNIPPGPVKWRRALRWEKGAFPNVRLFSAEVHCFHCEDPLCVYSANGAMFKEPKYGAVLIDPSRATDPVLRQAVCGMSVRCNTVRQRLTDCNSFDVYHVHRQT